MFSFCLAVQHAALSALLVLSAQHPFASFVVQTIASDRLMSLLRRLGVPDILYR